MPKIRILVVDDEQGMLEVCRDTLRELPDSEVFLESESSRAAERVTAENFDLLISDICMPDVNGVELLRAARQHDPTLSVLMLTAYPTVETAVESMKLGAADYLTKPFEPEDLLATARRLLEGKLLREENRLLRRQMERGYAFGEIIGTSDAIRKVFEKIQRVAETDFDVLIVGETGTGKELVARAIHQRSRRRTGPFVPIDCGAIPDQLMESEFFGYERGAFTGAHARSLGLMEYANKGTFFLDEIAQMPAHMQAKLLRVLQERKFRRVGSNKETDLDVRIVAASSVRLEDEVQKQRFRADFFHRINVVQIHLPSLKTRSDDIPLLVEHFVNQYCKQMEKPAMTPSAEAMEVLTHYTWPGNVRELQNVLKRALMDADQSGISVANLPDEIVARAGMPLAQEGTGFFQLREKRLEAFEKEYFKNLLEKCDGDATATAREAGLARASLYRFLKKHGLDPASFRS